MLRLVVLATLFLARYSFSTSRARGALRSLRLAGADLADLSDLASPASPLHPVQPNETIGSSLQTPDLASMRVVDIRELFRAMGGAPGNLRKQDLIARCRALLLQTRPSSSSAQDTVVSGPPAARRMRVNNLPLVDAPALFNQSFGVAPLSPALASLAEAEETPSSSSTAPVNYSKLYKYPYGPIRDSRLDSMKTTYSSIDLTFLGTASCIPSVTRGVNSIALRYNAESWLFDCGEGSQIQIQRSKVRPSRIRRIFITHNHGSLHPYIDALPLHPTSLTPCDAGDHSFGIPGMLCLMGQATQLERQTSNSRGVSNDAGPVEIYGPEGIRDMIRAMLQCSYSRITVPHVIHELKNVPQLHARFMKQPPAPMIRTRADPMYGEMEGSRDIYPDEHGVYACVDTDEITVLAAPMQHTVPCVGYVVQEKPRPGRLNAEVVRAHVERNYAALKPAFPNPMKVFARIKEMGPGEAFTFPDGTVLRAEDVLEPARRGRKVVIMGDTCSGDRIASLCMDADVVVHEATNSWIKELDGTRYTHPKMLERDTFIHGHSTPRMAGRFAKQVRAKRLLLTHFSPRYRGDEMEGSMRLMWQIEDLARGSSELTGENEVVAAWDLMVYPVPGEAADREGGTSDVGGE